LFDQATTLRGFVERRLIVLTGIPELPCIFGQGHRSIDERAETVIDRKASLPQFFKAVRFPKRNVMPREQCLEAFLDHLLTMKQHVADQWWLRRHSVFRGPLVG
jgi:hypothetical protein